MPDVQAQQRARDRAILEYIGRVQGQEANQATNVEEADISQAFHLKPRLVRASLTRLKRAGAIDSVDSHDGLSAWITDEGWELLDEAGAS
jgi:DNA-binding transcriptional regulator PaaX